MALHSIIKMMKMRLYTLFVFIGLAAFCSCNSKTEKHIRKTEWLTGTWENKSPGGSMYETWTKISENELSGKSYVIQGKDTIVFETIKLIQEQDSMFFIPTIKDQNNDLPVRFTLKTISDTEFVFENPKHDFPQMVTYQKIHADSLVAEVSGMEKGKERKETFPMRRVK
jgi:hypothetical protein